MPPPASIVTEKVFFVLPPLFFFLVVCISLSESIFINFVILFLTYFSWYEIYTPFGVRTAVIDGTAFFPLSDIFLIPCASLAALQHLSSYCLIKVCLYLLSFSRSAKKRRNFFLRKKKKNTFCLLIYRLISCRKLRRDGWLVSWGWDLWR